MSFEPIENYGVIGNMRSIALVGVNGSIDFLCYPNFDSPSVFAALLDDERGGCFQIQPQLKEKRVRQLYLPDTNILLTRFLAEEGLAELTDYMPIGTDDEQPNEIIRTLAVIRGQVDFTMRCRPRFNYAMCGHTVTIEEGYAIFSPVGDACPPMALYSTVALRQQSQDAISEFSLRAGERATFVFGGVRAQGEQPEMEFIEQRFHETARFWKAWIAKSKYKGRWREMVNRSALLLKLMISREHGSLVASPTFSLPEEIGGVRNWDYRFTWLRDATFTLYALINAGFQDEARAWRDWLLRAVAGDPAKMQILYGVAGERRVPEYEMDWLPGYAGSRPVRVGNAAHEQFQLDVYGEMMDALHEARRHGLARDDHAWSLQRNVLDFLEGAWDRPDEGIWEVRGVRRHFVHSKVLAWVAFDRAVEAVERFDRDWPTDAW